MQTVTGGRSGKRAERIAPAALSLREALENGVCSEYKSFLHGRYFRHFGFPSVEMNHANIRKTEP